MWIDGAVARRLTGSLLWTHFGISGPVALNASRHWLRAQLDRRPAAMTLNFRPGMRFDQVDTDWQQRAGVNSKSSVHNTLASVLPASVAAYAEATAGGVTLSEIDGGTMASRICPRLSCVGEILDVDGRIGGFNFQWAWSSGFVAGRALAAI